MRPRISRIVTAIASIPLFLISIFFIYAIAYIVGTEIMPAAGRGTLSVETSSMILNRVWEGNEIYLLLVAYAVFACAFAWGGYRLLYRR